MHEQGSGSWGYCIEGYPRTQRQLEDLEQQLGRLDVALLIDCTEQYCKDNITKRYKEGLEHGNERKDDSEEIVQTRLSLFKQNTLPMLKNLDDKGKLRVVRLKNSKKVCATFKIVKKEKQGERNCVKLEITVHFCFANYQLTTIFSCFL